MFLSILEAIYYSIYFIVLADILFSKNIILWMHILG